MDGIPITMAMEIALMVGIIMVLGITGIIPTKPNMHINIYNTMKGCEQHMYRIIDRNVCCEISHGP